MHDQIYDMLMKEDEITWQDIIYNLIKKEGMDPWDVDVSILSKRYIEAIKNLKEANFFISGKVLLASALLLKIKSDRLLNEHIAAFDNLLNPPEDIEELPEENQYANEQTPPLLIKTPQPRKRKVGLKDLMGALQKAMNFNQRRVLKKMREDKVFSEAEIPVKKIDVSELIKNLYLKIKDFFVKKEKLSFTSLVGSNRKEDKIMTFIPLLYLANQNKVELEQDEPFGEINIKLVRKGYY